MAAAMENPLEKYDLNGSEEAGHVLIFNHYEFKNPKLKPRNGTKKDVSALTRVFEAQGCKVESCNDLTIEEIKGKVNEYAEKDHSSFASLAVFVLTHGHKNGILNAKDGLYKASVIWQPFINCNTLQGKFKLFVFQACRGEMKAPSVNTKMLPRQPEAVTDGVQQPCDNVRLPHHPDVLVAYSTMEDFVSFRSSEGSWFIQTLCKELALLPGGQTDILALLTKVNCRVLEHRTLHKKEAVIVGQAPIFVSFCSKMIISSHELNNAASATAQNGVGHLNGNPVMDDTPSGSENCQGGSIVYRQVETVNNSVADSLSFNTQQRDSEYQMPVKKQALIFYDLQHETEASEFKSILKLLRFTVVLHKLPIKAKNKIENDIKKESEKFASACKRTSCILVAVFAKLKEDSLEIEGQTVANSVVWKPFLISNCKALVNKPKLFFFMDACKPRVEVDGSDSPRVMPRKMPFATDTTDMLFVRGYGLEFINKLFAELPSSSSESLIKVITRALGKAVKTESGLLSHFESSLRQKVVFREKQRNPNKQKPSAKEEIDETLAREFSSKVAMTDEASTSKRKYQKKSEPATSSPVPTKKAKKQVSQSTSTSKVPTKKAATKISTKGNAPFKKTKNKTLTAVAANRVAGVAAKKAADARITAAVAAKRAANAKKVADEKKKVAKIVTDAEKVAREEKELKKKEMQLKKELARTKNKRIKKAKEVLRKKKLITKKTNEITKKCSVKK